MYFKIFLFVLFSSSYSLYVVYCFDPCSEQNKLVTDLKGNSDCGTGFFYLPEGNTVHKCFPRCFEEYDLKTVECSEARPCPQGYTCPQKIGESPTYCSVDNESCFKYYTNHEANNIWEQAWWKPECLPDGTWSAKQCKGEQANGRCFCFDAKGNRIFGEAMKKDSSDMTCTCSRRRSEQINSEQNSHTHLHCDSKGNYEPLQCDKGHCLCVDPKTGNIASKIVSEGMLTLLPCYKENEIGGKYLRQCESEKYAQEEILSTLKIHGTDGSNFLPILCDGDGTYGAYSISNGVLMCTWKDKSPIENYRSEVEDGKSALVNCNCARDIKLYQLRGQTQTLICSPNGNYRPEQQIDGKWYCVDQDGFRKSEFFDTKPKNCDEYV